MKTAEDLLAAAADLGFEAVYERLESQSMKPPPFLMAPPVARPSVQLLTREGPSDREVEIIGVELAYSPADGGREVELEMFKCQHTLPKADRFNDGRWPGTVRVTLHTSDGDVTLYGSAQRF